MLGETFWLGSHKQGSSIKVLYILRALYFLCNGCPDESPHSSISPSKGELVKSNLQNGHYPLRKRQDICSSNRKHTLCVIGWYVFAKDFDWQSIPTLHRICSL